MATGSHLGFRPLAANLEKAPVCRWASNSKFKNLLRISCIRGPGQGQDYRLRLRPEVLHYGRAEPMNCTSQCIIQKLVLDQFNLCLNIVLTVYTACCNRYVPLFTRNTRSCTLVSHCSVFVGKRYSSHAAQRKGSPWVVRTVLSFRRSGQSSSGRPWHRGRFRKHADGHKLTKAEEVFSDQLNTTLFNCLAKINPFFHNIEQLNLVCRNNFIACLNSAENGIVINIKLSATRNN